MENKSLLSEYIVLPMNDHNEDNEQYTSTLGQFLFDKQSKRRRRLLKRLLYFLSRHGETIIRFYKKDESGNFVRQNDFIRRIVEAEVGNLLTKEFCTDRFYCALKRLYKYSFAIPLGMTIFIAEQAMIDYNGNIDYLIHDNKNVDLHIEEVGVETYLYALMLAVKCCYAHSYRNNLDAFIDMLKYTNHCSCMKHGKVTDDIAEETKSLVNLVNKFLGKE